MITLPTDGKIKVYDALRPTKNHHGRIRNNEILDEFDKEKPVCMFLQGPSLENWKKLDPPFNEHSDCVFASVNNFEPVDDILKKINRRVELLWCSSEVRYNQTSQNINDFIKNDGILFTSITLWENSRNRDISCNISEDLKNEERNIIFSDYGINWLNSFTSFIIVMGVLGWKKVYLFGADGSGGGYYQEGKFDYGRHETISQDTNLLNRDWEEIYDGARQYLKIPYLVPENIINVNNNTELTCFNTITEDDFRKQFGE